VTKLSAQQYRADKKELTPFFGKAKVKGNPQLKKKKAKFLNRKSIF
jgi:hypothetical protein